MNKNYDTFRVLFIVLVALKIAGVSFSWWWIAGAYVAGVLEPFVMWAIAQTFIGQVVRLKIGAAVNRVYMAYAKWATDRTLKREYKKANKE
jgi:hypothetical protein